MEVFIRNLSPRSTSKQIEEWLQPTLEQFGIHVFDVSKNHRKPFANLTIADATKAANFLWKVQSMPEPTIHPQTGKLALFSKSRRTPDKVLLTILRKAETALNAAKLSANPREAVLVSRKAPKQHIAELDFASIEVGRWEANRGLVEFVPFFVFNTNGKITKSGRTLVLSIDRNSQTCRTQIVMENINLLSIVLSRAEMQERLVISMASAPKLYQETGVNEGNALDDNTLPVRKSKLPGCHDLIAGSCLVYWINLATAMHTKPLQKTLNSLTSTQVSINMIDNLEKRQPEVSFLQQVKELQRVVEDQKYPFEAKFQLQALWANAILSPREVQCLLPPLASVRDATDEEDLLAVLYSLHVQLEVAEPVMNPSNSGVDGASSILSQKSHVIHHGKIMRNNGEVWIHRALVTPSGTYLCGPYRESPNRVIRQYVGNENCFLRVSFADESGDKVQFNAETSNSEILHDRFLSILRNGLVIAGRRFEFLGFSHSSLRSQACWFMQAFTHNGSSLSAKSVIQSLGNFTKIRCPAKCAARIGQAFSDTQSAVAIDDKDVQIIPDIENELFKFSDGCGTISTSVWALLRAKSLTSEQPTLYQIRYKGAKGMLSLDSRLSGSQMCLRKSMIKFDGSSSNDIEICGTNSRPYPFKLNRQMIKILEDLGIAYEVFETLQTRAVEALRKSASSARSAVDFLCFSLSNNATGISDLIRCLVGIGIEVTEDEFLRKILEALIVVQLRDIKFKGRIPVDKAVTLYGICDETQFLQEGQVFVTFEKGSKAHVCLQGRVAVTRSPALHPGDVQIATAAMPPPGSPLLDLTNCIVFSQKGDRDIPSMLSGGDLDGDLYNIIFGDDLIPLHTDMPAKYESAEPIDIQRSVTSDDITAFFIDFMQNDQLGRIATLHQVFADQEPEGTRSQNCLKLAALHSTAVDFSKTGSPVNHREIPVSPRCRPDFMVPSASTKVENDLQLLAKGPLSDSEDFQRFRYYQSERILGKLFRSIDEEQFFNELQDDNASIFSRDGADGVLDQIWRFVLDQLQDDHWVGYLDTANDVKDYYSTIMLEIMSQYAVTGTNRLTEKEVIIGKIIGKSGSGSWRQREQSDLMTARYKREIQEMRRWMKVETDGDTRGYLSLAVACLSLCIPANQEKKQPRFGDHLKSFAWLAAAICVPKLANPRQTRGAF